MSARNPDDETRKRAGWLVDQIQNLAISAPLVLHAIERTVRDVVAEHRRQMIAERLEHLDVEGLDEVDAFLTVIERHRLDAP